MRRVVSAALYEGRNLVVVTDDGWVWATTLSGTETDGYHGIVNVNQRWQKITRVPGTGDEQAA